MLPIRVGQWATVRPSIHGNSDTQLTGTNYTNLQDQVTFCLKL